MAKGCGRARLGGRAGGTMRRTWIDGVGGGAGRGNPAQRSSMGWANFFRCGALSLVSGLRVCAASINSLARPTS